MSKRVGIFCGAKSGTDNHIIDQSKVLCDLLIQNGYDLVYGGANIGLMGIIADRFLQGGREVIGIRPRGLIEDEGSHDGITEMIVVDSMHERKAKIIELSDVFIALPGGVGTLDEIIETFTLFKIGFIDKPSGLLNTLNYYDGLKLLLDTMVNRGFLDSEARQNLAIADSPEALLAQLGILE